MRHPSPSVPCAGAGKRARQGAPLGMMQNLLKNGIQKPRNPVLQTDWNEKLLPTQILRSHQQHCALLMNTAGQYWRSGGRGISLYQVGS